MSKSDFDSLGLADQINSIRDRIALVGYAVTRCELDKDAFNGAHDILNDIRGELGDISETIHRTPREEEDAGTYTPIARGDDREREEGL